MKVTHSVHTLNYMCFMSTVESESWGVFKYSKAASSSSRRQGRGPNQVSPIYNIISFNIPCSYFWKQKQERKPERLSFVRYYVPYMGRHWACAMLMLCVHVVACWRYKPPTNESHLLYGNCWWMVTHILLHWKNSSLPLIKMLKLKYATDISHVK